MNLQVCVPYQKCPFNCPMCIAKDPHIFDNIYKSASFAYFSALKNYLIKNNYKDVVLTGDTEPSLNKKWVEEVPSFIKVFSPKTKVEIQTHNYKWEGNEDIDVNAFSITTVEDAKHISNIKTNFGINRLVVLGSKNLIDYLLDKLSKNELNLNNFSQITFKLMQPSNSGVKEIDEYIDKNICDRDTVYLLVDKIANKYNDKFEIRVDIDCQNSYNRYQIFRENGCLYNSWGEI